MKLNDNKKSLNREALESAYADLKGYDADSKEYSKIVKNIQVLQTIEAESSKPLISPDIIVTAGTHIGGLLLVLHFEKLGVITSRAFNLITKLRI